MNNEHKPNGTAPVTSQTEPEKEIDSMKLLRRIEDHTAKAIKLQWAMVRSLQSIDASIEILAAQKKRELDPEQTDVEKAE